MSLPLVAQPQAGEAEESGIYGPQISSSENTARPGEAYPNVAVPAPLLVRIDGMVTDTNRRNTSFDTTSWRGGVDVTTPLDFGLSDNPFFDSFGWRFRGQVHNTEDVHTTYSGIIQPFWRDQEIGYVELEGRITHLVRDQDNVVGNNKTDTTYSAAVEAGTYLIDDVTVFAFAEYADGERSSSKTAGASVMIYPGFAPIDNNVRLRTMGRFTETDPDFAPSRDQFYFDYEVEWLLFPQEDLSVSLFAGAAHTYRNGTGWTARRFFAGFRLWLGPEPASLMQRDRWH